MNRNEMIERLVNFSVETALQNPQAGPQSDLLREIFEKGLDGFRRMPMKNLERELQLRGLIGYDEPDDAFEDSADCDESELMVMLSGMVGPHCHAAQRHDD